jgi:hypothetical protein
MPLTLEIASLSHLTLNCEIRQLETLDLVGTIEGIVTVVSSQEQSILPVPHQCSLGTAHIIDVYPRGRIAIDHRIDHEIVAQAPRPNARVCIHLVPVRRSRGGIISLSLER